MSSMDNVSYVVEGTKLIIEVDLSARGSVSSSGKTVRVASSKGNPEVATGPDGESIKMGLNVYVPVQ